MQMILSPIKSKAEVLAEKERLTKANAKAAKKNKEAAHTAKEEEEEEEFDESIFEDVVLESDDAEDDDDSELETADEDVVETIAAAGMSETSMPITSEIQEEEEKEEEEEEEEEERIEESVPVAVTPSVPEAVAETPSLRKPERASDPLAELLKKPPVRPPLPGLSRAPSVPANSGRGGSGKSDSLPPSNRQRRARAAPVSAASSSLLQKTKRRVDVEPPLESSSPSTSRTSKPDDELVSAGGQKCTVDENDPLANLRRPVRPPT